MSDAVEVVCGSDFTIVRGEDGTVQTFGNNTSGQLGVSTGTVPTFSYAPVIVNTFADPRKARQIFAGHNHAAVIDVNNKLYVWGSGENGKLGLGDTADKDAPVEVDASVFNNAGVSHVSLGENHTVVVCRNTTRDNGSGVGQVYTAGLNDEGQLGRSDEFGTSNAVSSFAAIGEIPTPATPLYAACGNKHTVLHMASDRVVTFGSRLNKQTGANSSVDEWVPQLLEVVSGASEVPIGVRAISTGAYTTYIELAPSGENQNGYGSSLPRILTMGMSRTWGRLLATQIACGNHHTMALDSDGKVYTWGRNNFGQLGNGDTATQYTPGPVTTTIGDKTIVAVAGGSYHTIALDSDGKVYTWGRNNYGQLGNGTTQRNTPGQVTSLSDKTIVAIAGGYEHTMALDSDGKVYTWGYNVYGQLGHNGTTTQTTPGQVTTTIGDKTIVAIACGSSHTMALDSDGKVYTWGYNNFGNLGNGNTTTQTTPGMISSRLSASFQSVFVNFTGQHRCFIDGLAPSSLYDQEGLIVVSDKNKYVTDNLSRGRSRALKINQALPLVSLANTRNDSRVFGVISLEVQDNSDATSDTNNTNNTNIDLRKLAEQGDVRVQINSIGEGCIWVSDENGPVNAGDYVTSSKYTGYGSLQVDGETSVADNTLRNYTVAKLTMDCDFTQPYVDIEEVQKDAYGNVVLDSDGLPVYEVATNTMTVRVDTGEPADPGYEGETTTQVVIATEPAYEMRWFSSEYNSNGVVTSTTKLSKEEYDKHVTDGLTEGLWRAAFVGCTYHCG
jgi:alpha-tubulin suppressor-like RCC1 family protein